MTDMKTLDDFRRYYAEYLSKELGTAEATRKSTIVKAFLVWVVAIPVTVVAVWALLRSWGRSISGRLWC